MYGDQSGEFVCDLGAAVINAHMYRLWKMT